MKKDAKILIVDGPLPSGKPSKPKYRTARMDGDVVRVRVVDADSPDFGADFEAAFRANVRRARQDNRAAEAK
ncbi:MULTISPECIES: hypothetical protein [Sphingomonadales]|jgi:hypothetical protein|nr:hypothetical protein HY78_21105 [Rhizorhabdus wittichii DC-6]